jgi:glycosyltransferase involved in cell wall biosynthesis
VVQNLGQADGRRRLVIPHWPQPGLLPRDPARGSSVHVVAFKGWLGNLAAEYHGARWREFLQREQLEFRADAAEFKQRQTDPGSLTWNDYREIDVVLAVRAPRADLYPRKPATKLYNAWHAGVPALLGPEVAYRELRQSPLDFIEVADVGEVMQAILQLKRDPDLYQRMVEHGRSRAREFTAASIAERWSELLFRTIPSMASAPDITRWRNRPLLAKELVRRVTRAWSDKSR